MLIELEPKRVWELLNNTATCRITVLSHYIPNLLVPTIAPTAIATANYPDPKHTRGVPALTPLPVTRTYPTAPLHWRPERAPDIITTTP